MCVCWFILCVLSDFVVVVNEYLEFYRTFVHASGFFFAHVGLDFN